MIIENVFALVKQLEELGFPDLSGKIAKQMCFQPESFVVIHSMEFDKTDISFQIVFGKGTEEQYALRYFDASVDTPTLLPQAAIIGINPVDLNALMSEVDWRKAFDFNNAIALNPTDKSTWANEEKIASIVKDLQTLDGHIEGKALAAHFRAKYWTNGTAADGLTAKRRTEVWQRFYVLEGNAAITVDEACRFLKNRQCEKQMNERKKIDVSDEVSGSDSASGSGLLKKRRSAKTDKRKKNKQSAK